jgi:hypothetical protein
VARERKGLELLKKRRRVLAKVQNLSALHGTERLKMQDLKCLHKLYVI